MSASLRRLHKVCHSPRYLFLHVTLSPAHFRTLIRSLASPISTNYILQAQSFSSSSASSSSSPSSSCPSASDYLDQFLPNRGSDSISNSDVINLNERRRVTIGLSKMIKQNHGYVLRELSRRISPDLLVEVMRFLDDRTVAFAFFKLAFQDHSADTIKLCCVAAHLLAAGKHKLLAEDVIYWVIVRIGSDGSQEFFELLWQNHIGYFSDFSGLDSLMRAFLRSGMYSPALEVLARMREVPVVPSSSAISILISLLLRIGDNGSVWILIRDMIRLGPCISTRFFNYVIKGFCKKGCLEIGESLFYIMGKYRCVPDFWTYNILINAYCAGGRTWEAYKWIRLMIESGYNPNFVTFEILISAFCKEGNVSQARKIFDNIHEAGASVTTAAYNALLDGYMKAKNVDQANMLFDQMRGNGVAPNAITFNILVAGNYKYKREAYAEMIIKEFSKIVIPDCSMPDITVSSLCWAGRLVEAIDFLMEMFVKGKRVTVVACNSVVTACSKAGLADKAFEVYKVMVRYGFTPSSLTFTSLLMGLCYKGFLYEAQELMNDMRKEGFPISTTAFTILLDGYFAAGDLEGAENLWQEMERYGISPDAVTFSAFIGGLSKAGNIEKAWWVFEEMLRRRFVPNNYVYNSLITGLCNSGKIDDALRVIEDMKQRGQRPDNVTANIIINWFCKERRMQSAIHTFVEMHTIGLTPDIVTYNTLLDGYYRALDMDRAQGVLEELYASGHYPDIFTYTICMRGYCSVGRINHAIKLLDELVSAGILPNTVTYNTLINGVCKDLLDRAMILTAKLLKMAFIPNIVTTNSLLSQFCKQGLPEKALFWGEKLSDIGCGYNAVTEKILDRALEQYELQGGKTNPDITSKKVLFLDFLMHINCDILQRNDTANCR